MDILPKAISAELSGAMDRGIPDVRPGSVVYAVWLSDRSHDKLISLHATREGADMRAEAERGEHSLSRGIVVYVWETGIVR